jgi:hypothetical protein
MAAIESRSEALGTAFVAVEATVEIMVVVENEVTVFVVGDVTLMV